MEDGRTEFPAGAGAEDEVGAIGREVEADGEGGGDGGYFAVNYCVMS